MPGTQTVKRTLLAIGAAATLTMTGCANSTPGTAERPAVGGEQTSGGQTPESRSPSTEASSTGDDGGPASTPCEALSEEDVEAAYGVDGVTSREGPTRGGQGIEIRSCQYVREGVVVAVLQAGSLPGVDSASLLDQMKQGMRSSGANVTSEPVSGVGDVAVYLPKFDTGKQSMLAIKQRGEAEFAMGSVTVADKPGVDARAALTTLTRTAMDAS